MISIPMILLLFFSVEAWSIGDGYPNEFYDTPVIRVPEPMHIDLVRPIGSKKGDWEVNTLIRLNKNNPGKFQFSPEIEWVFMDQNAIELELPSDSQEGVESFKFAYQYNLDTTETSLSGVQFILENNILLGDQNRSLYTFYHLWSRKISSLLKYFSLTGLKFESNLSEAATSFSHNSNIFLDWSCSTDIGLEINLDFSLSESGRYRSFIIPQWHQTWNEKFKTQIGPFVYFSNYTLELSRDLGIFIRIIWEENSK